MVLSTEADEHYLNQTEAVNDLAYSFPEVHPAQHNLLLRHQPELMASRQPNTDSLPRLNLLGISQNQQTFDSLVQDVLCHRLFPLVFKGVYETCNGTTPVVKETRSAESITRATEESIQVMARFRSSGLSSLKLNHQRIELMLSVLVEAFKSLQSDTRPAIRAQLHSIISACAIEPKQAEVPLQNKFRSPPWVKPTSASGKAKFKLNATARMILETWFENNFTNPYPNEQTKMQLARDCGLKLNQVRNL